MNRLRRLLFRLRTFRNYGARLNRSADVEATLFLVANGKRGPLSPDECRELALKLGVPDCYRRKDPIGTVTLRERLWMKFYGLRAAVAGAWRQWWQR